MVTAGAVAYATLQEPHLSDLPQLLLSPHQRWMFFLGHRLAENVSPAAGRFRPFMRRRHRGPERDAEAAAGEILLRRARLGAVRGDLRVAGVLPDAHRDGAAQACGRRDRPLYLAERRAGRVWLRRQHQDQAGARRGAAAWRLCADGHQRGRPGAGRRSIRSACRLSEADRRAAAGRFHQPFALPEAATGPSTLRAHFSGSTIGNFRPDDLAVSVLQPMSPQQFRRRMRSSSSASIW